MADIDWEVREENLISNENP